MVNSGIYIFYIGGILKVGNNALYDGETTMQVRARVPNSTYGSLQLTLTSDQGVPFTPLGGFADDGPYFGFGALEKGSVTSFEPKVDQHPAVMFILSGSGVFRCGNRSRIYRPGYLFVIQAGITHGFENVLENTAFVKASYQRGPIPKTLLDDPDGHRQAAIFTPSIDRDRGSAF